jgi:hypothetical protein
MAAACAVSSACAPVSSGGAGSQGGAVATGQPAAGSGAAPAPSSLTTADVESVAAGTAKLLSPVGKYDAAALARLIDSKAVTDSYFEAAVVAAANVPAQPGLGEEMLAAEKSWRTWAKGKTNEQVAALTNLGQGPDVPGLVQEAVYESHMLVLALASLDVTSSGTPARFAIGPSDTVTLFPGQASAGDTPQTYGFARGADGRWRVVGFGHDALVKNLEYFYANAG